MKYKGHDVPAYSRAGGVRRLTRGRNRGQWVAFIVAANNQIFYSEPGTEAEAHLELDRVICESLPIRVYV